MRLLTAITFVVALAAMPLLIDEFLIFVLTKALIFGLFAMSVDLLFGYCGVLSLGQAAYFGLGAYTYTLVTKNLPIWGVSYVGITAAVVVSVILGILIVLIGLRTWSRRDPRTTWKLEIYFAIITLAIALIFETIVIIWTPVTGGLHGIVEVPFVNLELPLLPKWELSGAIEYYGFVAVVCVIVYYFCHRLVASPTGAVMIAVRDNPERTEFLGYNVNRYRAGIFLLAAAIAGLAGALFAPLNGLVTHDLYGFLLSFQVLMWVAIGGRGTLIGGFIGAIAITMAETLLTDLVRNLYLLFIGGLFIAVVIFFPRGVMGFVEDVRVRWTAGARP
jgi:urea transport system permease protein